MGVGWRARHYAFKKALPQAKYEALLRCSKCGSDAGFLIETDDRRTIAHEGKLLLSRILKSVIVTCMYCNNRWDYIPYEPPKDKAKKPRSWRID